ncbi:hypothetical protein BN970_03952 [Mycolicibacterium conceptionense]|uniref:Uncharacterized protein n=1 Tax=Mycolicibacterium conceptionense TaxID=451644 RepID=A0A0U1DLR8_9MYCO|nr:hypothetical protein BN970_03952 [Mycolicibacterium conceptionense]
MAAMKPGPVTVHWKQPKRGEESLCEYRWKAVGASLSN